MQGKYLERKLRKDLIGYVNNFPVVAILGTRQVGKSTLAKMISSEFDNYLYLDLEKPSDFRKVSEPELFFGAHSDKLICLDEIQRVIDLFPVMRSVVDENNRNGQFLILGSASLDLIRQSSETLAGRIVHLELTPFLFSEVKNFDNNKEDLLRKYWVRGGFPRSFLARNGRFSVIWRENFVNTFLERDVPQLNFRIPAETLRRLWKMCAHNHGQLLNASKLGEAIGVSHTTIRSYIDLLSQTFMLRVISPLEVNVKKRLIKSPKVYIRDSGILHTLLEIDTFDDLMGHPIYGLSWEGMAMENILSELPDWSAGFYRTSAGAELDLVITKGRRRIGVEFKASVSPQVSKGFWNAINDLGLEEIWIVAPVKEEYPIKENVKISPLDNFISRVTQRK